MPHIHEKIDFVADIFIVNKNRVLLRKHDKFKIWLAPGGHIELDEEPNQAAIREAKEEVGLDIKLFQTEKLKDHDLKDHKELIPPRFLNIHKISDTHQHISHVFFATAKDDNVKPLGNDVSNEWKWFTMEDLSENKEGIKESILYYAKTALNELKGL